VIKSILQDLSSTGKALALPNYFNLDMDWNHVIKILDDLSRSSQDKDFISNMKKEGFQGIGSLFHKDISYFQSLFHIKSSDPKIKYIIDTIYKDLDIDEHLIPNTAQSFVNVLGGEYTTSKHRDNWGVAYMQIIGSTDWSIYDQLDNKKLIQKTTINEGDLIVLNKGVIHQVHAKTPRFAISLSLNDGKGYSNEYID